ncbi:MAG: dihydrolipoyl dehydrogenase [Candidatus Azobacteroides sp.]|nr:dihydrolipoyl dehydrogenase [Candidatus Azobacteroides sp.]
MIYDVLIIGGGPAGYTAAERAGEKGLKVLLIEENALGGVCLNEGCIPTKTLLYSAKVADTIRSAGKYGIETSGMQINLSGIVSRKNKIIRKLQAGIKQKMKNNQVEVISGHGYIKGKEENIFHVVCNKEEYLSKQVILCTGSSTFIPPLKGLENISYWTSREALNPSEIPTSIAIIGGGIIGIEFACLYHSLGTKVTVIELQEEILPSCDPEIAGMLRTYYEKKGIIFHLSSRVINVTTGELTIESTDQELQTVEFDTLLISTGRKTNMENLGLENLEINKTEKGTIAVDAHMETSIPGLYACGDITGFYLLAHTACREAEVAVNHITRISDKMSYKAVPSVVYTNPEIASVGYTEEMLRTEGISYKVLKLPMAFSGRFVVENEGKNGLCKILTDKNNYIKGVHLLGNPASEFITVASMAIESEMTIEQWKKVIFPHPTVHEIMKDTLFAN